MVYRTAIAACQGRYAEPAISFLDQPDVDDVEAKGFGGFNATQNLASAPQGRPAGDGATLSLNKLTSMRRGFARPPYG